MQDFNSLQLSQQLCFPLYVVAKEIIGLYRPFLEELDITYSQYLVLMVLWEQQGLTVNQIGEKLYLDSGTLTPLLKRLEKKGFIIRKRKKEDERVVEVFLDKAGLDLKEKACKIPGKLVEKLNLSSNDYIEIKDSIQKIMSKLIS
ncbi:MarR family winged helix-turn-helix transcriptional regulator [Flavobacterium aquiphilum]|uniref:MarR family winged helix-turn-helix transcriptional regulator n=1 Tax=Flavobacterium aquiphilum TaxID=3003261 RepID=UPI00247FC578|nr:MarR family transcriptional regulator [Flavobacterium aquiphilum]